MRFVLAIVAFIVAAAMIGLGIAQRTVFAPEGTIAASTTITDDAPFIVIDGSVLNAHPSQQTLRVAGSDALFVGYGRTADVHAWLGDEHYAALKYDAADNTLRSRLVVPKKTDEQEPEPVSTPGPTASAPATPQSTPQPKTESTAPATDGAAATATSTPGPNPVGSDLWLEDYTGTDAAVTQMNIPNDVSVIIASDGTLPAPKHVTITWPLDTSTPWAGPLIAGGLLLLLIGIILLILGLLHLRKSRGPRRSSGPKMPKLPKAPKYRPSKAIESTSRGRRSRGRGRRRMVLALTTVALGSLALTGCSADYWPTISIGSTPQATPTALNTDAARLGKNAPQPVVTVPQLQKIVAKISTLTADADANLTSDALTQRFTNPALALRTATYALLKAKVKGVNAPNPIPAGQIKVALPQATDATTWPRVVLTVLKNAGDADRPPLALVLEQKTPRENYMVTYAIPLQANASVPKLAPASIGTSIVPPDYKLLKLPPAEVASAYADVLANGTESTSWKLFDMAADKLEPQVASLDSDAKKNLAKTASLAITMAPGSGPTIALATINSGAIVSVEVNETQTVKVVEAGAEITGGSSAAALTGKTTSKTGYTTTFSYQLMFYVPPAESNKKITPLGFAQGMISAKEIK